MTGNGEQPASAAAAATESAERAFRSAVSAEHEAIAAHVRAEALHRQRAARLSDLREKAHGPEHRRELTEQMSLELERAAAAVERADTARARLRAEGEL
jgi:hypothetical protein